MVDIRSHILRGLDDGTETLEESVAMLKLMAESDIVATPHANSRYRFQTDVVTQRIAEVSEGLSGKPHIHCGGGRFSPQLRPGMQSGSLR
jgi:protein-tyrosine phosphatase